MAPLINKPRLEKKPTTPAIDIIPYLLGVFVKGEKSVAGFSTL
jgi:hypothetical protein